MRRLDYLITDARLQTENEDFSDTVGIDDEEFVRFFNEAQTRIHSLITQQHSSIFLKESTQALTSGTEAYSLPSDCLLANKVTQVDYSHDSGADNYTPLKPIGLKQRRGGQGSPMYYIRKSAQLLINPIPQDSLGSIRITYIEKPRRLDIRRGSVSSFTDSGTQITALTLDVSTDTVDSDAVAKDNFLCIVDRAGNIKMADIEYDSIDATTGVVTLTSNHTYTSGESIVAGDYIVVGKNASTHSELADFVERYLLAYVSWKILKRDSSADYSEQQEELAQLEKEIIDSYADISDDIMNIPEINEDEVWFGIN